MLNRLTMKGNIWAPMKVFLLTSLTSVNVSRRHTLPEMVSSKVPEITFWIGKWRMLMETKLVKVTQCSLFSSWVLGRPLRTRPRSEYLISTTLQMKQKKNVL